MQHFAAPAHGLFFQIRQRNDGVNQPHVQRLLRIVLAAQEPDFTRFLLTNDTRHIRSAPAAVKGANFRTSLAEDGVFRRDGQVTHHVQHMTTADGISRDHRDNRFWTGANLALEIQHVQVMHAGVILITAVIAAHLLVAARAKRFIAFAGQNNHTHVVVVTGIRQRLNHLFDGQRTKCIAHLRTINGDFCNTVGGFFITNVGVTLRAVVPFYRCVKHCFIRIDHSVSFSQRRRI